jgi:hypothetical protein
MVNDSYLEFCRRFSAVFGGIALLAPVAYRYPS